MSNHHRWRQSIVIIKVVEIFERWLLIPALFLIYVMVEEKRHKLVKRQLG